MIMSEQVHWRYAVVGNIVKTPHPDSEGIIRYGTPAFSGGTKVYLAGKTWDFDKKTIEVVGLCRGKKYQVHSVPVIMIENVRCGKAYTPHVTDIMSDFESWWCWWERTKKDKKATENFVAKWHSRFGTAPMQLP